MGNRTRFQIATLAMAVVTSLTDTTYAHATPAGVVTGFASEAVPLYFYNEGPTCHLLMGAPSV